MISVIICTYNRDKYIYNVLESIAKNDYPHNDYEIVLIDNNCTDNTKAEVRRFSKDYPDICFRYFLESEQGLSYARNRGIKESAGNILIFLDDDAFPSTDYLKVISHTLSEHQEIDAFGGKITPIFENGQTPEWLCKWSYSWVSAINLGDTMIPFKKGYPIGANMGFRRKTIEQCGYFNTELGRNKKNLMGGEEKEFFLKIKKANLGIFYIPGIEVHHIIPPSRTTIEYIKKLGQGIGASEKIRCRKEGCASYLKRLFSECVKWAGTLALWGFYTLRNHITCGNALVVFRCNVTKGLLRSS